VARARPTRRTASKSLVACFPQITHPKKRSFLGAFSETGNVSRAAGIAGITRKTHTNWLKADAVYAEAFDEASEAAADLLELEARRRAHDGVMRVKFHSRSGRPLIDPRTKKFYAEHEYSDTLLIFLLKGLRPDKYREKFEHTGAGGGPIETRVTFGGRFKPSQEARA
jgi:hypothetical protein